MLGTSGEEVNCPRGQLLLRQQTLSEKPAIVKKKGFM